MNCSETAELHASSFCRSCWSTENLTSQPKGKWNKRQSAKLRSRSTEPHTSRTHGQWRYKIIRLRYLFSVKLFDEGSLIHRLVLSVLLVFCSVSTPVSLHLSAVWRTLAERSAQWVRATFNELRSFQKDFLWAWGSTGLWTPCTPPPWVRVGFTNSKLFLNINPKNWVSTKKSTFMKKCVRTDPTIPSYMAVYVGLIINKGIPDSSLDMCLLEKWKQMKVIPASVIPPSCFDGGRNNQNVCWRLS